ncbi:hypothetical protein T484DRAFT_1793152 [Baffinella frigidus]|nr:hypothetical protein T484DRAFT_1793152 [Cryptophyta sp. CCMP2293]
MREDIVAATAPGRDDDVASVARSVVSLVGSDLERYNQAQQELAERRVMAARARKLAVIEERTRVQQLVGQASNLLETNRVQTEKAAEGAPKVSKAQTRIQAHHFLEKNRASKQPKGAAAEDDGDADFEIAI